MVYIIFDLEWNNAYNYKTKTGMNEIIEIGAVKLNDNLEIVDTFKQLIKPRISKKLGSRFKNLTHITIDEINQSGIDFDDAFRDFSSWSGTGEKVFISWSTSDLYTLISNYRKFKNTTCIDFMDKYADAQRYCMSFIENTGAQNQIGLSNCASIFEIDIDENSLHRALADCYLTALCMKKVFDKNLFRDYIVDCDEHFFNRLVFKPYFINKEETESFRLSDVEFECPVCKGAISPFDGFQFSNNAFKGAGECTKCHKKFWLFVRAKQNYDSVSVNKRLVQISKKRAKYVK